MYISDNLTTLLILSATWKQEIQAVIWQNLPFQQHLGRRILDKKITQPCDFGKNLVCWRVYISDNLMTQPILSTTWKPEIQAVIWQNLPFEQHLGRRILDKKLPSHAILAKIWYVGGCTSLTICQLCQFLVLPGNQKCRLLFDRTYHLNNTWEGEYLIKNYPAMRFWQKFGMSEGVHLWQSDNSANS